MVGGRGPGPGPPTNSKATLGQTRPEAANAWIGGKPKEIVEKGTRSQKALLIAGTWAGLTAAVGTAIAMPWIWANPGMRDEALGPFHSRNKSHSVDPDKGINADYEPRRGGDKDPALSRIHLNEANAQSKASTDGNQQQQQRCKHW